jgi:MoaA/NifB/PqqE/SkfB family radical SAM enzyme
MQVYTHRQWYKDYDYVVSHRSDYEQYRKVIVDIDAVIYMQDLGRAKTNPDAQREVERNPHFMSCLNATLVAIQKADPQEFGITMMLHHQFCKPSVDCEGNVHLSESRLCPSVGNVTTDSFADIWSRMRRFRPCGQCAGCRRFMESQRPDIARARQMIFGEEQNVKN